MTPSKKVQIEDSPLHPLKKSPQLRKTVIYGSIDTPHSRGHHRRGSSSSSRRVILHKTQSDSFLQDARVLAPGSIPHSMVLAATIGVVCGVAAWLYYAGLEFMLDYLWERLPEQVVKDQWPEHLQVLWIPLVGFTMALGVGLTVRFLGEPGDLPYTIKCVHEKAYVSLDHVMPMVCASQFSILAGGSLGPEAPLVAICAALGGAISRFVFGCRARNLVRKHTLMGMAGALAAFFGVPLGGSLFALEVNSVWGAEYFEHILESIMCGEVTLAVFRLCARLPIEPIWSIADLKLTESSPLDIAYGAAIGIMGAGVSWVFASFHKQNMALFRHYGLLDNKRAVQRALAGAVVVIFLGMLVPYTMFWGEYEFQSISTMSPASSLAHIWPTTGLIGFEMDSLATALIVAVTKLIAISFTVAGGYRGGYIFPAFAAAAALGRVLFILCPFIPVQLCVLCMAAALNVALTRTSIATTLILAYLSGEQNATASILAASLMSLFLTGYSPFIHAQVTRVDLDDALFFEHDDVDEDDDEEEDDDEVSGSTDELTDMVTPLVSIRKEATELVV